VTCYGIGGRGQALNLIQLRYFVAAARAESFTAAALHLNVAQSALSRQIANLEADLGVALFHRAGKRVQLAPAGARILPAASKLLVDLEDIRATAQAEPGDVRGVVRFGCDPSLGDVLFPRLIVRLRDTHPGVQLDPFQYLSAELQGALMSGRLDAAIISFPDPLPGHDLELLGREAMYFLAPAESGPHLEPTCTVAEALSHPLILPHKPHRERLRLDTIATSRNIELQVGAETDRLPLSKQLAAQGLGCLVLNRLSIIEEREDPRWRVSLIVDLTMSRYLARRTSAAASPAVNATRDALAVEIEYLRAAGDLI
jgi:LysR family transcriptional regulator, nitrogen assimilation regulatory protein